MAKILIVDDDSKILTLTGEVIENEGHQVVLSESPENALTLLKENPKQFDLIILDWKLKSPIDGDVVLKMIKSIYPDFATPIIFVTAHTKISSKYLMRLGAYDTVEKPATTEQLLDAVNRALKNKPPEDPHKHAPAYLDSSNLKEQELVQDVVDAISTTKSLKEAAQKLKCSRASLYRWLKKTGLYYFYIDKEQ